MRLLSIALGFRRLTSPTRSPAALRPASLRSGSACRLPTLRPTLSHSDVVSRRPILRPGATVSRPSIAGACGGFRGCSPNRLLRQLRCTLIACSKIDCGEWLRGRPAGRVKIPYYAVMKGRGYWCPTRKMKALGFSIVRCGPDGPEAWKIATEWNERWQAVRKGDAPAPNDPSKLSRDQARLSATIRRVRLARRFRPIFEPTNGRHRPYQHATRYGGRRGIASGTCGAISIRIRSNSP
jgi:hypothetical protein